MTTKKRAQERVERVFAFGGGQNSMAGLVLACQGLIDFDTFLFANTGDDSEHPDTLAYVHNVAIPYAEAHGKKLIVLQRTKRNGEVETLYGRITKDGSKSVPIPVRLDRTGKPAKRACTADFKVAVIKKWLKAHGASWATPTITAIGFTMDEIRRVKPNAMDDMQRFVYPLIDRDMVRQDCVNVIARAGLPIPPKSACWFCPFHNLAFNIEMRQREPDLFWRKVKLEQDMTERRQKDGFGPIYMTDQGARLKLSLDRIAGDQGVLDLDVTETTLQTYHCDGVYCST